MSGLQRHRGGPHGGPILHGEDDQIVHAPISAMKAAGIIKDAKDIITRAHRTASRQRTRRRSTLSC
jgi:hypothetical protein